MTDDTPKTYVILLPERPGNPTKKYLVVTVDDYVKVSLGESNTYNDASEHDDYDSAALERDRINHTQQQQKDLLWAPAVLKLSTKTSPLFSPPYSLTSTPTAAAS